MMLTCPNTRQVCKSHERVRACACSYTHCCSWFYLDLSCTNDYLEFVGLFLQTYEKVAAAFKSEKDVVVANLDADKYKDLAEK